MRAKGILPRIVGKMSFIHTCTPQDDYFHNWHSGLIHCCGCFEPSMDQTFLYVIILDDIFYDILLLVLHCF